MAGGKTVVRLPVHVEGDLGAGWKQQLDQSVADGLARGNFDVVVSDQQCGAPACWKQIASTHDAAFLVHTEVQVTDGNYAIALQLIDGSSGEVMAETTDECEVCGMQNTRELVADQAAALRTKLDALVAGPPSVVIGSSPATAIVQIDGQVIGQTPVRRELTAGKHIARAEKAGYVTVEREFVAVEGVEERMDFELPPLPDIGPRFRPWGWVGIGTGAASIAAGVTLMVLDERPAPGDRCSGDNVDTSGNCRFRYDTLAPGLILTTAGAILALAGTAVLVAMRPRRRARRSQTTWSPTALGLRARF